MFVFVYLEKNVSNVFFSRPTSERKAKYRSSNYYLSTNAEFLYRGSTEPRLFEGAVSGIRWKSFKILTPSGAFPEGRWPLDFEGKIGRRKT